MKRGAPEGRIDGQEGQSVSKKRLMDPPHNAGDGREKPSNKLFVGNLHRAITEANIIQLFSKYGTITSERFFWHTSGPKRGEPKGFCFVEYATKEEAGKAIKALDDQPLKGRRLNVRYMKEHDAAGPVDDARAILAKARAKASGIEGSGGGAGRAGGKKTSGSAAAAAGGGGSKTVIQGGAGDDVENETAIEKKIRMLKHKIHALQKEENR